MGAFSVAVGCGSGVADTTVDAGADAGVDGGKASATLQALTDENDALVGAMCDCFGTPELFGSKSLCLRFLDLAGDYSTPSEPFPSLPGVSETRFLEVDVQTCIETFIETHPDAVANFECRAAAASATVLCVQAVVDAAITGACDAMDLEACATAFASTVGDCPPLSQQSAQALEACTLSGAAEYVDRLFATRSEVCLCNPNPEACVISVEDQREGTECIVEAIEERLEAGGGGLTAQGVDCASDWLARANDCLGLTDDCDARAQCTGLAGGAISALCDANISDILTQCEPI